MPWRRRKILRAKSENDQLVIGRIGNRPDDRHLETPRPTAHDRLCAADLREVHLAGRQRGHRHRPAADKDRQYFEALRFKKAPSQRGAERNLTVPSQAGEHHPEISLLLGEGKAGRENHEPEASRQPERLLFSGHAITPPSASLSFRVNRGLSVLVEGQYVIGLRWPVHARRAGRHPRNRKPQNPRLFFQQTQDQVRRHMPFDHIALDDRGVTGIEFLRNFVLNLYVNQLAIAYVSRFDFEPVCS
jgi:hypothetical protein